MSLASAQILICFMAYFFFHFYFSFGVVRVLKDDVPHVAETIEYL